MMREMKAGTLGLVLVAALAAGAHAQDSRGPGPFVAVADDSVSEVATAGARDIWAFTSGDGLLRSSDEGNRWEQSRLPFHPVGGLHLHSDGQRAWVIGEKDGGNRVYATKDAGRSWVSQTETIALADLTMNDDGLRGWAVGRAGLYRTVDGVTWHRHPETMAAASISFDAAGVHGVTSGDAVAGSRVLWTSNGGGSWEPDSRFSSNERMVIDGTGRCAAAVGLNVVWIGPVGGARWQRFELPRGVFFRPDRPFFVGSDLWVRGDDGAYRLTGCSSRVTKVSVAFPPRFVTTSVLTPNRFVVGGLHEWVAFSSDAGATWRTIHDPRGGDAGHLSVMTTDASGERFWGAGEGGVLRSDDGGASWSTTSLELNRPCALAFLPDGRTGLLADKTRVFVSADGGRAWTQISQPGWDIVDAVITPEGAIWVVGANAKVTYRADARSSWRSGAALPSGFQAHRATWERRGGRLWVSGYVDGEKGRRTYSTSSPEDSFRQESIAESFDVSGVWFSTSAGFAVATVGGVEGLFRTLDSGASWQRVLHPSAGRPVYDLASDDSGMSVFMSTDGGFFRTADGGRHWARLPSPVYFRFAFTPDLSAGWTQSLDALWRTSRENHPPRLTRFHVDPNTFALQLDAADDDVPLSSLRAVITVSGRGMDLVGGLMRREFRLSDLASVPAWPASTFQNDQPYEFELMLDDGWNILTTTINVRAGAPAAPDPEVSLDELGDVDPRDVSVQIRGEEMDGSTVLTRGSDGKIKLKLPPALARLVPQGVTPAALKLKGRKMATRLLLIKDEVSLHVFRPFQKSYALIIAIEDYKSPSWDRLPGAIAQAKRLEAALRAQGFEILPPLYGPKATKDSIEKALLSAPAGPEDRLLVYFSGHGAELTGFENESIGYIVPWGGEKGQGLVSTAIAVDALRNYARVLRAKQVLFALDSCQSGLVVSRGGQEEDRRRAISDIEAMSREPSRVFLTAGRGSQAAHDDNGGVFTKYFINGILGGADTSSPRNAVITFWELYEYVRSGVSSEVRQRWSRKQDPEKEVMGSGAWVFILDGSLLR